MRFLSLLFLTALSCVRTTPAHATTKGLSQIVTPDLQPAGDLSRSGQWQSVHISNLSPRRATTPSMRKWSWEWFTPL